MADGPSDIEKKCTRGVRIMSLAFFGLFAGFGATQSLQTSLNKTLGFINLACLYFMFVIVGLVCPRAINSCVGSVGWRAVLIGAGLTYILMIVSNLDTESSSKWVIQPIANAILGAGAAVLWTTQNVYFGQAAYIVGNAVSTEGTSVTEKITALSTSFNSSFFGVFQFSNSTGNLVASVVLLAAKGIDWLKTLLFSVLAAAAVAGTAAFLLLPEIDHTRDSQDEPPSIGAALRAVADVRFALLLPWIITNGMTFALVNGEFTSDVVTPLLGEGYVGFLMTVFFGVDAFFSVCWGRLITQRYLGRRTVFIGTGLLWIAFLLVKILWTRTPNFDKQNDWKQVHPVEWLDVVLPVLLAVLAGAADGFWTPGPPAVLQSFFANSSNLMGNMAAYKALQSLGFAIQFTIGAVLGDYPTVRGIISLCCVGVSLSSVMFLDTFKQPLDPRAATVLTSALNSEGAEPGKSSA